MRREPAVAILILSILLFSCSNKYSKLPTSKSSKTEEDKILFIAYEITRDSVSGKITANILYQRTADGSIKPGSIENAPFNAGNWTITAGNLKEPLETLIVENPLHQQLEYVGSNGALQIKEVWLPRAELAIRMNYTKAMRTIDIAEIGNDKNNRIIFSHAIEPIDQ
jgi:hypothetical protein